MKKTIYTLNVNDYSPEITELTYPLLKRYAEKIGASFFVITERKYPDYAPVYEKLQIYDLQRIRDDDWSIFIDSDALVHPDLFDPTEFIGKDTILHNGIDMANNRWRYDRFFRRDGRHIGSCNWFTIGSDWCRELWRPLDDLTYNDALSCIYPIQLELNTVITKDHLIDDYILSRNIAKFGLHVKTLIQLQLDLNDSGNYLWHQYTISIEDKVSQMREILKGWGLNG
jgi:hypothetical protein